AHAVIAAPAGLAASIAATAMATASTMSGGFTLNLVKLMTTTKLKLAAGVLILAGVGITLVLEKQTQAKLRQDTQSLRHQIEQLEGLAQENQRLSNQLALSSAPPPEQLGELLRLRGEVGRLRQETNELAELLERKRTQPRLPSEVQAPQLAEI